MGVQGKEEEGEEEDRHGCVMMIGAVVVDEDKDLVGVVSGSSRDVRSFACVLVTI